MRTASCRTILKQEVTFGPNWDTWELLTEQIELDLPNDHDSNLLKEILARLPELIWCDANPLDLPDYLIARYDWARFSEVVMHRRRFFFENYGRQPHDEYLTPGEVLQKILDYAQKYELFQPLPCFTKLFRARCQGQGTKFTTAQELGPPPKEHAIRSNRMSPAGMPMFYACDCPETALRETADKSGRFAVGKFRTRRHAIILDLTKVPPVPSLFREIPDSLPFRPQRSAWIPQPRGERNI